MDATILAQAAGGFTAGLLIAYALKKLTRWFLLIIGILLIPIFILWQMGVLSVNWDAVSSLVASIVGKLSEFLSSLFSNNTALSVAGVSTLIGFMIGLIGFQHSIEEVKPRRYVRRVGYGGSDRKRVSDTSERDTW